MKTFARITIVLVAVNIVACAAITFTGSLRQEQLFSSPLFALLQVALILGLVVCMALRTRFWLRRWALLLLHLGLVIVAVGGALTAGFGRQGSLAITEGKTSERFMTGPRQNPVLEELGFSVALDSLDVRYYPHSTMWQSISSHVRIIDETGMRSVEISVNKPLRYRGWRIYQMDFSQPVPGEPGVSFLHVTRETGYPFVYAGCALVCVALVLNLFISRSVLPDGGRS